MWPPGRSHCQAALTLCQHHHNPVGEAAVLDSLGYIEQHTASHHRAVRYYHRALTLFRDLGHTYQVADTLDALGNSHAALGHYDQAHTMWQEALHLYRDQGRDEDAARLQRQLDDLNTHDHGDQPRREHGRAGG